MNKRSLGKTGIEVSELAFGAVEIGMPYGIGVHSKEDMLSEAAAIDLLHAAFEKGINFIDTARQYGQSEAIIGKAFKDNRDQVVIATKCRHLRPAGKALPENLPVHIIASLMESITALQTNYVDVFMLHDSDPEVIQHPVVIETFAELKKEGLIRASGVSTYSPAETLAVLESGHWDVVQVPFNLLDQRHETLFALARDKGVGIVIRSVLMKGLLANSPRSLHPALAAVEKSIAQYQELAAHLQTPLSTLATRFPLSFKEVSSVLVGLDKMEYLRQSVEAANGEYLSGEELLRAKMLAFPNPDFLNLHQWSVQGWLV